MAESLALASSLLANLALKLAATALPTAAEFILAVAVAEALAPESVLAPLAVAALI